MIKKPFFPSNITINTVANFVMTYYGKTVPLNDVSALGWGQNIKNNADISDSGKRPQNKTYWSNWQETLRLPLNHTDTQLVESFFSCWLQNHEDSTFLPAARTDRVTTDLQGRDTSAPFFEKKGSLIGLSD